MRILKLTAQNIQRLSAVEIAPDESPVVVLAGDNENGKSSCLDAIEMALGGEKAQPPEPIRRGQEKAAVVLDLGDLIVTRKFSKGGKGSITVTNRDGLKYPSPQSLLDGLYSKLTFDPLAFATAKPADQTVTLRALAQLDTSDLELARQAAYDARTVVNRDLTRVKAALVATPEHPEATETLSLDDLTAALEAADNRADEAARANGALHAAATRLTAAAGHVDASALAVEEARAALEAAELEHEAAKIREADAREAHRRAEVTREQAMASVPDRAALRAQIGTIQATNQQVEANRRRAALAAEVAAYQADADAHTERIEALDAAKADRLARAVFPVDGLGLDDTGVTWQGLPFEQASTAVRTRVSVAIGLALHPKLKVLLVRNGNDLDSRSLTLIAETAGAAGAQLWIERIAGGNGLQTIVIEDGAVAMAGVPA